MHRAKAILITLLVSSVAHARDIGPEEIGGEPTHVFEGPHELVATGAPMLICSGGAGGGSTCNGVPSQLWNVGGISEGGRFERAWLVWSHSKESADPVDRSVTLTLPDADALALQAEAEECVFITDALEGGDMIGLGDAELSWGTCRHDVTDALNAHLEAGGSVNGRWEFEDMTIADTGLLWQLSSLVVGSVAFVGVLSPDVATPHRKIYLYNGFRFIEGPAAFDMEIAGFLAPPEPQASVLIHVLEGDGGISGDQLRFNGDPLADACNPQDNVWNGTINVGRADGGCVSAAEGTDLDMYEVGRLIEQRDESASLRLQVPGEQLFTNFVAIQFDSVPEFIKPSKGSAPRPNTPIGLGETIRYDINVLIGGEGDANQVVITDPTPEGTRYVAGSATIDGEPVPHPAGEDASPLAQGLPVTEILGRPLARGDRHVISFEVCTVAQPPQGRFSNVATLDAQGVEPEATNPVIHPYSGEGAAALCDQAGGQEGEGEGDEGEGDEDGGEESGDAGGQVGDGEGGEGPGEEGEGEGDAGRGADGTGGAEGGTGVCPPGTQRVAGTNECVSDCRAGFYFDELSGLCVEGPAPGADPGGPSGRRGTGCNCGAQAVTTSRPWWRGGLPRR